METSNDRDRGTEHEMSNIMEGSEFSLSNTFLLREARNMKTYNGLYEKMLQPEAVKAAVIKASKGKRKRKDVKAALDNIDEFCNNIISSIEDRTLEIPKHKKVIINEASTKKTREITIPRWKDEQILHHMLMLQMAPLIHTRLNYHVYGSIPGKGTHKAMHRMKKWIKAYGMKKFYVAELDIKKFYDNIDHEILKQLFRTLVRDKRFLYWLDKVVDTYYNDFGKRVGIPIGNYTSQWFANFYLIEMDNHILEDLKPDHYLRYMDNLYLFCTNKRQLHRMVNDIIDWVQVHRNLKIKSNWQVFRFEDISGTSGRAINALGFIVHRTRVTVRKSILKSMRKKGNQLKDVGKEINKIDVSDALSMVSRYGYIKYTDTFTWFKKYIQPNVDFRACKQRIAIESRKIQALIKASESDKEV